MSPSQHEPPAAQVRPLPAVPADDPWRDLSPLQVEEELWWAAECPDDPEGLELRAHDPQDAGQSDERDRLGELIAAGDTRWSLDLDDPYAWRDDEGAQSR